MRADGMGDARAAMAELLFVFFLVELVVVFWEVAVFAHLAFFFLIVLFVLVVIDIFGNEVEMNGVDLSHLEFRLTFRAAENFTLFYLVLVDVDLSRAFGTADHDSSSVQEQVPALLRKASTTVERII
jgi:hypothetical protein